MSNYLWDKSGEADADVEELEELLGTLGFKADAVLPPESLISRVRPRSSAHWSEMAAAAALILVSILSLWVGLRRLNDVQGVTAITLREISIEPQRAIQLSNTERTEPNPANKQDRKKNEIAFGRAIRRRPLSAAINSRNVANNRVRENSMPRVEEVASTQTFELMSAEDLAEARRARNELLFALQVASAKLNHAQRKAQNTGNHNPGLNP